MPRLMVVRELHLVVQILFVVRKSAKGGEAAGGERAANGGGTVLVNRVGNGAVIELLVW